MEDGYISTGTTRQRGGVDEITHNVRSRQGVELDTRYGVFNDKKDPYVMEAIDFPS